MRRVALIVAGPTCSGKSALALRLARDLNGVVINADSMQVYRDLRILTARPDEADEAAAPHRLYGVLDAAQNGSVAWWRQAALAEMDAAWARGALPILCGGTGLYLRALTEGLAEIPDPGAAAREEARALAAADPQALHARLATVDPDTARSLRPSDPQRVARAWEVWRGTGHGLAWWRGQPGLLPADCRFLAVRLDPPRDALRAALAARFERMLADGALEEVARLTARGLDPSLPAMRAHGVPELAAVLRGDVLLAEAQARAVSAISRYTKRQATWFRHQRLTTDDSRLLILLRRYGDNEQESESDFEKTKSFISGRVDPAARSA